MKVDHWSSFHWFVTLVDVMPDRIGSQDWSHEGMNVCVNWRLSLTLTFCSRAILSRHKKLTNSEGELQSLQGVESDWLNWLETAVTIAILKWKQYYKSYLCYCCNMILCLYLWVYFYFLCNVCVCFFSFFPFSHKVASLLGLCLFCQPATWFIYVQLLHYIAIRVVANKVFSLSLSVLNEDDECDILLHTYVPVFMAISMFFHVMESRSYNC